MVVIIQQWAFILSLLTPQTLIQISLCHHLILWQQHESLLHCERALYAKQLVLFSWDRKPELLVTKQEHFVTLPLLCLSTCWPLGYHGVGLTILGNSGAKECHWNSPTNESNEPYSKYPNLITQKNYIKQKSTWQRKQARFVAVVSDVLCKNVIGTSILSCSTMKSASENKCSETSKNFSCCQPNVFFNFYTTRGEPVQPQVLQIVCSCERTLPSVWNTFLLSPTATTTKERKNVVLFALQPFLNNLSAYRYMWTFVSSEVHTDLLKHFLIILYSFAGCF